MTNKILLFIVTNCFCIFLKAQNTIVPTFSIKINPVALINLNFPSVNIAGEWYYSRKCALFLEPGVIVEFPFTEDNYSKHQGIKLRIENRFFLGEKNRFFLAPSYRYLNGSVATSNLFRSPNDLISQTYDEKIIHYRLHKQKHSFIAVAGFEYHLKKIPLTWEISGGVGFHSVTTDKSNFPSEYNSYRSKTDFFIEMTTYNETRFIPDAYFTFRIGYLFTSKKA